MNKKRLSKKRSTKITGKRVGRRHTNKQLRAVDRRVLGGGNHRTVKSDRYAHRAEQPTLFEE